jgi:hypothetical protein
MTEFVRGYLVSVEKIIEDEDPKTGEEMFLVEEIFSQMVEPKEFTLREFIAFLNNLKLPNISIAVPYKDPTPHVKYGNKVCDMNVVPKDEDFVFGPVE